MAHAAATRRLTTGLAVLLFVAAIAIGEHRAAAQPAGPFCCGCICPNQNNQTLGAICKVSPFALESGTARSVCVAYCASLGCRLDGAGPCAEVDATNAPLCQGPGAPALSWPALGTLVVVLGALAFYRMRQRV